MADQQQQQLLRFRPLQSCVDVSFWSELGQRKLQQYMLSESPVDIQGFTTASKYEELGSSLQLLSSSFDPGLLTPQASSHAVPGQLLLLNTLEAFNRVDKAAAIQQAGARIWSDIQSGAAEQQPHLLQRFLLLAHADLKHFVFTYWFAFPALKPPQPFSYGSAQPLAAAYPQLAQQMCAAADAWRQSTPSAAAEAAAEAAVPGQQHSGAGSDGSSGSQAATPPMFCLFAVDAAAGTVQAAPLSSWQQLQQQQQVATPQGSSSLHTPAAAAAAAGSSSANTPPAAPAAGAAKSEVVLVMFDPCSEPLVPGWPLRNALLLAAVRWGVRALKVVCVRDSSAGRAKVERCFVLEVGLPEVPPGWPHGLAAASTAEAAAAAGVPEVLGWEANNEGKLKARVVDLSPFMNPLQLADQAVDLNLRLMRWRAAPGLDVGALASMRCLLLGAGTLGCAVARTLLAWGVRHITFVDSARVSFSNPVRQSLFTYADCLEGGRPKAAAAAEALRGIFPSVQAAGVDLVIPMPGHPPANAKVEAAMQQAVTQLHQLVAEHDVVFLLTDTRESRWLPTLLAAAAGKVAITAALGFDSFLVMRHGLPAPAAAAATAEEAGSDAQQQQQQQQAASISSSSSNPAQQRRQQHQQQLGCYFCNDVIAPTNSTVDRTLDQQCTVARPGLAPIAGALAVELLAALLQHPLKGHAPAGPNPAIGSSSSTLSSAGTTGPGSSAAAAAAAAGDASAALGPVPHMVRGQLSGFSQTCMVGQAFSQCTACSAAVLQQYKSDGWGFVLRVLQQPGELEELTGLAELHRQAAAMDLSSASSEDGEGQQGGDDDDWHEL